MIEMEMERREDETFEEHHERLADYGDVLLQTPATFMMVGGRAVTNMEMHCVHRAHVRRSVVDRFCARFIDFLHEREMTDDG